MAYVKILMKYAKAVFDKMEVAAVLMVISRQITARANLVRLQHLKLLPKNAANVQTACQQPEISAILAAPCIG